MVAFFKMCVWMNEWTLDLFSNITKIARNIPFIAINSGEIEV